MYQIAILEAAEEDITSAINWYNRQSWGLGEKFRESLFLQIDKLANTYIDYGPIYKGLSRILLKRYPYVVFFKKDPHKKTVTIFGVLNRKRDRAVLEKRA